MSSLQVRSAESSVVRQKALEDAKKMQLVVIDNCKKAGKEPPPYNLQELIGKGSFGRVYKATDLHTKQLVAVKIIDIEESDTLNPKMADTYSEFLKEISALKLLSEGGARNVNHFLDALPVGQSMWMITEYCAGGSVATLMKPTAPGGLQEKWIIPILREVAEAIYWVHRQGVIHRDIKCANVLVTEAGGVQLCDFGVAGVIETKFDKRSTVIGTPHWMAPELFEQAASYGTEVDIWAFGAMVFEIASGLPPNVVAGVTFSQLGSYLKQHTPRLEGDKYSPQLKDLVAFCLSEDPGMRPPIEQVQRHPYIFGTADAYPTESLAMLVKGYKLWESNGGNRKSLFAAGGAQLPSMEHLSSTALANDEWNFSTTVAFDRSVFDNPDSQAVFDVYGSQVDYENEDGTFAPPGAITGEGSVAGSRNGSISTAGGANGDGDGTAPGPFAGGNFPDGGATTRPSKMKGRRRQPPPHLPAVKAPLEKVFDPNTISNYEENSREYYGRAPPPPTATATSDLPLRDDSLHSTLRESLIDLDASQIDFGEPSRFDMETIRAAGPGGVPPRISVDYDNGSGPGGGGGGESNEFNRPPLSDPADLPNNRRTQDWKFPSMSTPASANPEMSRFPFHEHGGGGSMSQSASRTPSVSGHSHGGSNNSSISINMGRPPPLVHHHTEPVGIPSYGHDLTVPGANNNNSNNGDNRMSVSSLIDLDEGLADPLPQDMTRPSTANSDVASVSGSEMGGAFDLEKHASLYQPMSGPREPSIYVSDGPLAGREPSMYADAPSAREPSIYIDAPAAGRAPSMYADAPSGREPSIYVDAPSAGREPSIYVDAPSAGREPSMYADTPVGRDPSIYVSDDSEFAHMAGVPPPDPMLRHVPGLHIDHIDDGHRNVNGNNVNGNNLNINGLNSLNGLNGADRTQRRAVESYLNAAGVYSGDEYVEPGGYRYMDGYGNGLGVGVGGGAVGGATGVVGGGRHLRQSSQASGTSTNTSSGSRGRVRGAPNGIEGVGIAYSTDDEGSSVNNDFDTDHNNDYHNGEYHSLPPLPPLPAPPSPHVMQGLGTREEVRDEMKRLLDSFKQHLSFTNTYVGTLPLRPAGGPVRQETSVEE